MGHRDHSHSQNSTTHEHRGVRHPIQLGYGSGTQWVADQPLPYAGHSAAASGVPETQGTHPDHTMVSSWRASEAVEIINQVSSVAITHPHPKLTKYIGPNADSPEH